MSRRKHTCGDCAIGHRRINGMHVATQRKGMIPTIPCDAVVAVPVPGHAGAQVQWTVYVDGELLRTKRGVRRVWSKEHSPPSP